MTGDDSLRATFESGVVRGEEIAGESPIPDERAERLAVLLTPPDPGSDRRAS